MKCYVINLDRQPERWQDFLAHAPEDGHYSRLSAVDRLDLKTLKDKNILLNCDIVQKEMGHEPTWGEIACTLSHAKAWRAIAEDESLNDTDFALVAEDDIHLSPRIFKLIKPLADQLKAPTAPEQQDIHLIRLHHTNNDLGLWPGGQTPLRLIGDGSISPVGNGASLYLLRKGKAKLLTKWLAAKKPCWLADSFPSFMPLSEMKITDYDLGTTNEDLPSDLAYERAQAGGYAHLIEHAGQNDYLASPQLMESLKEKLAPISQLILDKKDVVYLDIPNHLNVGDSLIWLGTEAFFKAHQIQVKLRRTVLEYTDQDLADHIGPKTTILLHGGGNFGDIYPVHQKFREKIIQAYPNNRIIMLPQTTHFNSEEELEKSQAIFRAHKECYLLARDPKSEALLRRFSDHVHLIPDMAHQLYPIQPLSSSEKVETKDGQNKGAEKGQTMPLHKRLFFMRKDCEGVQAKMPNSIDWVDLTSKAELQNQHNRYHQFLEKAQALGSASPEAQALRNQALAALQEAAQAMVDYANQVFSSYRGVETDRLHGFIFSQLLGIPAHVNDNSYGKNLNYFNTWFNQEAK